MILSTRVQWLLVGAVGGLAVVGASTSLAAGRKQNSVSGSAKFPSIGAEVRIKATGDPATGRLYLRYSGNTTIEGSVTCITVVGNQAVAGGVIVRSSDPSLVGQGFVHYVEDNGSPGTGDFSQTNGMAEPPAACPSPIHPAYAVEEGNYVVTAAR